MRYCLSVFLLLAGTFCVAQEECGTDHVHQWMLQNDAEYRVSLRQMEENVREIIENGSGNVSLGGGEVYTIPVVVHIIHLGEAVGSGHNIPDAQIEGAIRGLNNRFRNTIGNGLDIEIEFCLATRDPDGCATTGINRVDGSGVPNYASKGIMRPGENCGGASDIAIKNLSRWPVLDYYNIWVVKDICGGWAGYAYYPNGNSYDGTVIDKSSFKFSSPTLAHEVGHGLFLYHTFEGDNDGAVCPSDANCTTNGDRICDTPPHKKGDCGFSNPCSGEGVWNNSLLNYMSYCIIRDRFTPDQKARMRATLLSWPRSELLESQGCSPTDFGTEVTKADVSCNGKCDGSITVSPECASTYSYLWNNGSTGNTIEDLCPGIYSVTISNADDLSTTIEISISQPEAITTDTIVRHVSCHGLADGVIELIPTGGAPGTGYSYLWSNGQTTSSISGLSAGTYTAYVQDGNDCIDTTVITITQPPSVEIPEINATGNVLHSTAVDGNQWFLNGDSIPGANAQHFPAVEAGVYTVSVTDENGCTAFSQAYNFTPTPVLNVASQNIRIYPNPGNGLFYVDWGNIAPAEIIVYNLLGAKAFHSNKHLSHIDLSDHPRGHYIFIAFTAGTAYTGHLLKY